MNIRDIAQVCHEANRAYCITLGDLTQPTWDFAPTWQKDSAVAGVKFLIDNPSATPEQSHESWLAVKENDGWTYGPVKDPALKQHPCFVPYAELPEAQKAKDAIFTAIVRALSPSTKPPALVEEPV